MEKPLIGRNILVLVANGVDEAAMSAVQREMLKTGATIKTVGIAPGLVNSWNKTTWGLYFPVDQQINMTLGSDYDAVIVPSGSRGIEKLAASPHSERILASFAAISKPMVFMGDAVELLTKTAMVKDWTVTGPENLKAAAEAAGAKWTQGNTCVDNTLMTGECTDIAAFIQEMIAHLAGQEPLRMAA